jgi:hypothetical protein
MSIRIIILEIGSIIKHKAEANFIIIKVWYIQVNGIMIKCMVGVNRSGWMELYLLEFFRKVSKCKVNLLGLMVICTKDVF